MRYRTKKDRGARSVRSAWRLALLAALCAVIGALVTVAASGLAHAQSDQSDQAPVRNNERKQHDLASDYLGGPSNDCIDSTDQQIVATRPNRRGHRWGAWAAHENRTATPVCTSSLTLTESVDGTLVSTTSANAAASIVFSPPNARPGDYVAVFSDVPCDGDELAIAEGPFDDVPYNGDPGAPLGAALFVNAVTPGKYDVTVQCKLDGQLLFAYQTAEFEVSGGVVMINNFQDAPAGVNVTVESSTPCPGDYLTFADATGPFSQAPWEPTAADDPVVASFVVRDVPAGDYLVTLQCAEVSSTPPNDLDVLFSYVPEPFTVIEAIASITPASGSPGDVVTVSSDYACPGNIISVADPLPFGDEFLGSVPAQELEQAMFVFDTAPGTYSVQFQCASDVNSIPAEVLFDYEPVDFTVVAQPAPSISVEPMIGAAGDTVAIGSPTDCPGNYVFVDSPLFTSLTPYEGTGALDLSLEVNPSAAPGEYNLTFGCLYVNDLSDVTSPQILFRYVPATFSVVDPNFSFVPAVSKILNTFCEQTTNSHILTFNVDVETTVANAAFRVTSSDETVEVASGLVQGNVLAAIRVPLGFDQVELTVEALAPYAATPPQVLTVTSSSFHSPDCPALKVFLEGPDMQTDLWQAEARTSVFVYFRDANLERISNTPLAGLWFDTGHVRFLDVPLDPSLIGQQAHIEIVHVNHLDVMSADVVDLSSTDTIDYDFTIAEGLTISAVAQKELSPGVWAMYSGDANGDHTVDGGDKLEWSAANGTWTTTLNTLAADFDLSGSVDGGDKIWWESNNGVFGEVGNHPH